ncbi:MAG: sigma-70 family RNA polymerase sigma factor [Myxococcales bacterium]|nr:sigma-70 family RNA polymerase sigma factor [Myxococcales bacterium]
MKPAAKAAAATSEGIPRPLNEETTEASKNATEVSDRHADAELVKRVQNGDRTAFRSLYERYNRRAYAVAFGVVKNEQDALDVVQEAFIKVHKHLGNFQGSSSFYTWLYRIVMNLAIDHVRKVRKVIEFDDGIRKDDAVGDGALLPRIAEANPSKMVTRQELSQKIQGALDELPEYHRAVILMREVEGLSYEEMAQVLEVPKGTIMSRLFHARRKMQEHLRDYVGGELTIAE